MSSAEFFADSAHEQKFKSAFDDGRVRVSSIYWRPLGFDWYELATPTWTITPIAVPAVPLPLGLEYANPKLLYPEVKKAGTYLAGLYSNSLYWNPRNGGWVRATKAGSTTDGTSIPSLPPCVEQMKRDLAGLDALYQSRTLQEPEWREQRERVIEGCLGKGNH
jgi:hypothetical protein